MKTLKVATWLPLFSGFYETIWNTDYDEENEIDNINELRKEQGLAPIIWDDVEWDNEAYEKEVVKRVTNAVANELKRLGMVQGYELEKMVSPREYNFANDSIHVTFSLAPKHVKAIKAYLEKHKDVFAGYLKDRYTSCDGFCSSYSNRVEDWMDAFDETIAHQHQLGSILSFILQNDGQLSEDDIYEKLHNNGCSLQVSNYSELVPQKEKAS